MFKTDQKTLEELSFSFNDRDISNLKAILENLNQKNLLTISNEEYKNAIKGLDEIGKLKLDGKIYAFHVDDSSAAKQSCNSEGVELYLRQGNTLKDYYSPMSRDFVYQVEEAVEFLKKRKKTKIYTGKIPFDSNFLGVSYTCDKDDPIITTVLMDYEIEEFESKGINVIKLDSLI